MQKNSRHGAKLTALANLGMSNYISNFPNTLWRPKWRFHTSQGINNEYGTIRQQAQGRDRDVS